MPIEAASSDAQIAAWNDYVANHPQATPYHQYAWLQSVAGAYRHQTRALMVYSDKVVTGVLPLVVMSMPLVSDQAVSLPYCDLGGALADDRDSAEQLLAAALRYCDANGLKQLEIRQRSNETNTDETRLTGKKVRMLLPLPDSSEALFSAFKSKLRSQVNKSKKNGLGASLYRGLEHPAAIDDFYRVYCINMRMLGSPVHSKEWFLQIAQNYGTDCVLAIVTLQEQPIGAGIVLRTGVRASIPWASTNPEYNRLAPNMLLYWTLLEHCADNGIAEFDFGRSTYDEGTYRFKKQWGAKPELLQWDSYHHGQKLEPQHSKTSTKGIRSQVESGWRKLPLPVTTWMGPRIRKYISL